MTTFIISLKSAHERRMKIGQMAARIGMVDYVIVDAIDGNIFTEDHEGVDCAAFRANTGRDPVVGEVGCYRSHLSVYEKIFGREETHALVLEDDVLSLVDSFQEIVDVVQRSVPVDHLHIGEPNDSLGRMSTVKCMGKKRMSRQWLGTYSYVASRAFCAHMLSEHGVMTLPIDNTICRLSESPGDLVFASSHSPLFRHDWRMPSSIKRPNIDL